MRAAALVLVVATISIPAQEVAHSTAPVLVHKTQPVYASEALEAKLQGTVVLSAVVGADGIPSEIHVLRKLGNGLDEKAVECVQAWRFKPATHHGEPVSASVTLEVTFRLPPT